MVKMILHFLLTLPIIFGSYHRYDLDIQNAKYYSSLPGYVIALPDEQMGIFGDVSVNCRTVCKILSLDKVPYTDCSLYQPTKIKLPNCHDGYFLIGKEIPKGNYKIYNPIPLAQLVIVYDSSTIYNSEHIISTQVIEPKQTINLELQEGILYIEKCNIILED